jgi:putative ABC transport system permease protein
MMRIPRWLNPWRMRREQEEDLARELETHLAIARDEQQERGLLPRDARHAAYKQFGNVTHVKEEMREMSGWMWLDRLVQDARYALRMMRKSPGFALIAVCTLAIGIGANTAIFSVVDHILFRPFAYQHPEQFAAVHEVVHFSEATRAVPVNLAHFQEWRRNWRAAEGLAVIGGLRMSLTGVSEPERLQTMRVSANLFSLLGVQPQLGRSFSPEEDQLGRDRVVLLSDDLWRRRFNADPSVVGERSHSTTSRTKLSVSSRRSHFRRSASCFPSQLPQPRRRKSGSLSEPHRRSWMVTATISRASYD